MWSIKNIFFISKAWKYYRLKRILYSHKQVSTYWKRVLEAYCNNKLIIQNVGVKKEFSSDKIIWQYWGQGIEFSKLPEVVRMCFESVDKYKGEYVVIRLDDTNIKDYIEFPDFILEKLASGLISRTHFSDILRLALLKAYGGVWLDSTILLTRPFDISLFSSGYFMFQRDNGEKNKTFWENSYAAYWGWGKGFKVRVLNSIVFSKKDDKVISDLLNMMLYYWYVNNNVSEYFFFQILYEEYFSVFGNGNRCKVISDTLPHLLQTKFNGSLGQLDYKEILNQINIHKMSYFDDKGLKRMKEFINIYQILD